MKHGRTRSKQKMPLDVGTLWLRNNENCGKIAETKHQRKYYNVSVLTFIYFPFWSQQLESVVQERFYIWHHWVKMHIAEIKKYPCWLGVEIFKKRL